MGKIITDSTLNDVAGQLKSRNNFLKQLQGNLEDLVTTDKSSLVNAINEVLENQKREPMLKLSSNNIKIGIGSNVEIECNYRGNGIITITSSDTNIITTTISDNKIIITAHNTSNEAINVTVNLSETDEYYSDSTTIIVNIGVRYGYRIKKAESDPYERVEYLYDAEGKTPAKMNFNTNTFDYGDWGNEWFIIQNKPCMLKNDGTVDYYLNPDDYDYKEDGTTSSDISNTNYNGNAMAQIPLIWIKRYEDDVYEYEIISDIKYDDDYEAYAHTRADGSIAPFFFWSMFGGSGNASKIRSLADQARTGNLIAQQEIDGAKANGSKWYIHTWSQRECIRTLLVLMGKSTNTQDVFGNGNCTTGSALVTGTLKKMGQFFGYFSDTQQVKVFHIEAFWGDMWDRAAGLIYNNGSVYVKMTPESAGYRVTDTTGYDNTGITLAGTGGGYISQCSCSKYGIIPKQISGSGTTYYCDGSWFNNSGLYYLACGMGAHYTAANAGGFLFDVEDAPSYMSGYFGCALSCEMSSS